MKAGKVSLEEIGERVESLVKKNKIDVDKLIDQAIKWTRSK